MSPRHWVFRMFLFVGVLSLLLLIPAFEPFVAFVIQGAVVTHGIKVSRLLTLGDKKSSSRRTSFSLATMLQVVVLVAVTSAIATQLPELNLRAWHSVVSIGLFVGIATLASCWVVYRIRMRWWIRVALGSCVTLGASLPLVRFDWFASSLWSSWPPVDLGLFSLVGMLGGYQEGDLVTVWIPIICGIFFAVCTLLVLGEWLKSRALGGMHQTPRLAVCGLAYTLFTALSIALVIPPAYVYYKLVTPMPIPDIEAPNPNGYDDLQVAWDMMPSNLIVDGANFDTETATQAQLQQAVDQLSKALDRASVGIERKCYRTIDYQSGASPLPELQKFRSLARGFYAAGKLAERKEEFETAFKT